MEKKILLALIIICMYYFIWDLLKVIGVIAMTAHHVKTYNILFALSTTVIFGVLFKHRYWLIGYVFMFFYKVARISAAFLFQKFQGIYNIPTLSAMAIGMICTLMSLVYFYKLVKVEDFSFEKYLRFKDWDNFFKRK